MKFSHSHTHVSFIDQWILLLHHIRSCVSLSFNFKFFRIIKIPQYYWTKKKITFNSIDLDLRQQGNSKEREKGQERERGGDIRKVWPWPRVVKFSSYSFSMTSSRSLVMYYTFHDHICFSLFHSTFCFPRQIYRTILLLTFRFYHAHKYIFDSHSWNSNLKILSNHFCCLLYFNLFVFKIIAMKLTLSLRELTSKNTLMNIFFTGSSELNEKITYHRNIRY